MELCPDKNPQNIISRNAFYTTNLPDITAEPALNVLRILISTSAKSSRTVYFIIKYWMSHVIGWMLYWKWETEWLSGCRMAVSISCLSLWLCGWWKAVACYTAQCHKKVFCTIIASLGNNQNSKFQVWFPNAFHFGTIVKTAVMKVKTSYVGDHL